MSIESLLTYKFIIATAVVTALILLERILPFAEQPEYLRASFRQRLNRITSNLVLWFINIVASPLVTLPVTLYMAGHALQWRGYTASILLDILLLDLWIYWWHRANHELPLLWRFHRVHHLDQWLDVTTAFRFHVGEVVLSALVRGCFIWMMGISWQAVLVFELLLILNVAFHHSNVRLPAGVENVLCRVMVTPAIHWVHHHAVRRDTDSNYGTLLSVWDRLFSSLSVTARTTTLVLGVENEPRRSLFELLKLPFSRSVRSPTKRQPPDTATR